MESQNTALSGTLNLRTSRKFLMAFKAKCAEYRGTQAEIHRAILTAFIEDRVKFTPPEKKENFKKSLFGDNYD